MPRYYTTLAKLATCCLCADIATKLLAYLGKTAADDEPLSLETILDSNGLEDALWCLCAIDGGDRDARLYAVWCVRQQHMVHDEPSMHAIDAAERYANGMATDQELTAARAAAWAAARAAAWNFARVLAWTTTQDDARVAALSSARFAAKALGWVAARDVARAAQEAEFRRRFC